jgi:hypothetical protein
MKLIKIGDLFDVIYGVNLELNKLQLDPDGINFVARTAKNNGVSAKVKLIPGAKMNPAGTISVSGGGSVLETFLQDEPYYSGRDLYYLQPKRDFTRGEKLFYCMCIRANKYRYSYGRQANRTLKDIMVPHPEEMPAYVNKVNFEKYNNVSDSLTNDNFDLNIQGWKYFVYDDLFAIERGRGPRKQELDGTGKTPFITSTDRNNGFTNFTNASPIHNANTISVNRNGSVAEAFYQPTPFCSTEDVHIFSPKFSLNKYIAMFLITLIKKEKYRYSYGRKWGIERMKKSVIKLPVDKKGNPDWQYMENYIKALPFSKAI